MQFMRLIQRFTYDINCEAIFEGSATEVKKAAKLLTDSNGKALKKNSGKSFAESKPDRMYKFAKHLCNTFKIINGYNDHRIHKSELDFPLAFIILANDNVEQFERLLRLIYRPHNAYCIHIDKNSDETFRDAIHSIGSCFDNIIFASSSYPIKNNMPLNHIRANLICMRNLLSNKKIETGWKYVINLESNEFPLRTNYELTRILKLYNGANDIELIDKYPLDLLKYTWKMSNVTRDKQVFAKTLIKKSPLPEKYEIIRGMPYGVFSRHFANYTLYNKHVEALFNWAKSSHNPHEW